MQNGFFPERVRRELILFMASNFTQSWKMDAGYTKFECYGWSWNSTQGSKVLMRDQNGKCRSASETFEDAEMEGREGRHQLAPRAVV